MNMDLGIDRAHCIFPGQTLTWDEGLGVDSIPPAHAYRQPHMQPEWEQDTTSDRILEIED